MVTWTGNDEGESCGWKRRRSPMEARLPARYMKLDTHGLVEASSMLPARDVKLCTAWFKRRVSQRGSMRPKLGEYFEAVMMGLEKLQPLTLNLKDCVLGKFII